MKTLLSILLTSLVLTTPVLAHGGHAPMQGVLHEAFHGLEPLLVILPMLLAIGWIFYAQKRGAK